MTTDTDRITALKELFEKPVPADSFHLNGFATTLDSLADLYDGDFVAEVRKALYDDFAPESEPVGGVGSLGAREVHLVMGSYGSWDDTYNQVESVWLTREAAENEKNRREMYLRLLRGIVPPKYKDQFASDTIPELEVESMDVNDKDSVMWVNIPGLTDMPEVLAAFIERAKTVDALSDRGAHKIAKKALRADVAAHIAKMREKTGDRS